MRNTFLLIFFFFVFYSGALSNIYAGDWFYDWNNPRTIQWPAKYQADDTLYECASANDSIWAGCNYYYGEESTPSPCPYTDQNLVNLYCSCPGDPVEKCTAPGLSEEDARTALTCTHPYKTLDYALAWGGGVCIRWRNKQTRIETESQPLPLKGWACIKYDAPPFFELPWTPGCKGALNGQGTESQSYARYPGKQYLEGVGNTWWYTCSNPNECGVGYMLFDSSRRDVIERSFPLAPFETDKGLWYCYKPDRAPPLIYASMITNDGLPYANDTWTKKERVTLILGANDPVDPVYGASGVNDNSWQIYINGSLITNPYNIFFEREGVYNVQAFVWDNTNVNSMGAKDVGNGGYLALTIKIDRTKPEFAVEPDDDGDSKWRNTQPKLTFSIVDRFNGQNIIAQMQTCTGRPRYSTWNRPVNLDGTVYTTCNKSLFPNGCTTPSDFSPSLNTACTYTCDAGYTRAANGDCISSTELRVCPITILPTEVKKYSTGWQLVGAGSGSANVGTSSTKILWKAPRDVSLNEITGTFIATLVSGTKTYTPEITSCTWECASGYHEENSQCVANTALYLCPGWLMPLATRDPGTIEWADCATCRSSGGSYECFAPSIGASGTWLTAPLECTLNPSGGSGYVRQVLAEWRNGNWIYKSAGLMEYSIKELACGGGQKAIDHSNGYVCDTGYIQSKTELKCILAPIDGVCGSATNAGSYTEPMTNLCAAGSVAYKSSDSKGWNWICEGQNGGDDSLLCTVSKTTNGSCGGSHNGSFYDSPTTNLCTGNGTTEYSASIVVSGLCGGGGCQKNYQNEVRNRVFSDTSSISVRDNADLAAVMTSLNTLCPLNSQTASEGSITIGNISGTCDSDGEPQPTGPGICTGWCRIKTWTIFIGGISYTSSTPSVTGTGPWSWSCAGINGGNTSNICTASKKVDGVCGSANETTVSTTPSGGSLCNVGTVSNFAGNGPWSWSCAGINGGNTSNICTASKKIWSDEYSAPTLSQATSICSSLWTWWRVPTKANIEEELWLGGAIFSGLQAYWTRESAGYPTNIWAYIPNDHMWSWCDVYQQNANPWNTSYDGCQYCWPWMPGYGSCPSPTRISTAVRCRFN